MHRRTLTLGVRALLAGCAGAGGDAGTPTRATSRQWPSAR
jgi:hypothetical protein